MENRKRAGSPLPRSKSPVFRRADVVKHTPSEGAVRAAKLRSNSVSQAAGDGSDQAARLPNTIPTSTPDGPASQPWDVTSWQSKPIVQDVVYDDAKEVEKALNKLESLPPLVGPHEINKLKALLESAALGKAFILQGGDCAELFDYCSQDIIEAKLKILLQMSLVLVWGTKLPVVRIARIAGQFAKPRSKLTEEVDGKTIPSFRGDNINGYDVDDRTPDPARLVSAYFHSAATLNFIRSTLTSDFASLHHPFDWSLSHVQSDAVKQRYQEVVKSIMEGLSFMRTVGADTSSSLESVDLFTSHEGLHLEYEQTLTRRLRDPADGQAKWFNTSAHFLWIGDRTRQLNGAHVEYFRGIENPIGIKVGPSTDPDELVRLLDIVDADRKPGRVTLISRYGAGKIEGLLPGHIRAVAASGHRVVWISDPCHGNTKSSTSGLKTRDFDDIMAELAAALRIHKANGSQLNGVHLELTGDAVTECVGGSQMLTDEDLVIRYDTVCDPRLSESQSLDASFLIADWFQNGAMMAVQ
ncbi:DAHP synthetase [Dipodascopsis tothii]|uniref:DAHP synthetase n=1 Tax=Dipodascopsis tothii TaxID=44089 RepID=UPI0034CFE263